MDKLTPLTPDKIAGIAALAEDMRDDTCLDRGFTVTKSESELIRERHRGSTALTELLAEREGLVALPIALSNWRDNLRTTLGSPIMGDYLHGPALEFVIEQIDGLLAHTALKGETT